MIPRLGGCFDSRASRPATRTRDILAGLDVGASQIAVALGRCLPGGQFEVLSVGLADTTGVRDECVVDEEALQAAIASAVLEAELFAGMEIEEVHLGLSGSHVLGHNQRGAVATGRVIDWADRRRALDAVANAVALPDGRAILQVVAQDFVVDGQEGIARPEGLTIASRLEARAHVITCDKAYAHAVTRAVHLAGSTILSTRSSLMGASESVVAPEEWECGVAVVDIGTRSTGIAIFKHGMLIDTRTLAVGASAFARASTGRPCLDDAEAERFLRLVSDAVPEAAYALNAGLVLTGPGALVPGIADVAEQVFDLVVRYGWPRLTCDLAAGIEGAHFTAAVGLALAAHRDHYQPSVAQRFQRPPGAWTG